MEAGDVAAAVPSVAEAAVQEELEAFAALAECMEQMQ